MKKIHIKKISLAIAASCFLAFQSSASNETEIDSTLAGSGLDLYGVLDLFKSSESVEAFEKAINTESNNVNNLDLNDDNEIDYIKVIDNVTGTSHALVLQVAVSEKEDQDIAVVEIEKNDGETATLQIVGDEELYGKDYIVEPYEDKNNESPMARPGVRIVVNVWGWRPVRFIYAPTYRVWVSPYRWRSYPRWWKPWRPRPFYMHRRACRHYHGRHYHRVRVHRNNIAHNHYKTKRKRSAIAHKKHHAKHKAHRKGTPKAAQKSHQQSVRKSPAGKRSTGKARSQPKRQGSAARPGQARKKGVSKARKPTPRRR